MRVSFRAILVYKARMEFPQDLITFIYMIFFKPISLHTEINRIDPSIGSVFILLMRSNNVSIKPIRKLALFHIFISPFILALGTGTLLSYLGMDVNWLKLVFYLFVAIALSLTFHFDFCIAFLLPFSVAIAVLSSIPFTQMLGILFSLMLGLAYGLRPNSARWGLIAALTYGVVLSLVINPLTGLSIGAAFLIGYFRVIFYFVEAPLSWTLAILSTRKNALDLWRFNPVMWDELIWFPLLGLDKHLSAIIRQNESASNNPILHVRKSFRQGWAVERISSSAHLN